MNVKRPNSRIVGMAMLGLLAFWPALTQASLIIGLTPTSPLTLTGSELVISPGQTGSFEVYVQPTVGDTSDLVSGDGVKLSLPTQSSVTFTGFGATTNNPYIFGSTYDSSPSTPAGTVSANHDIVTTSDAPGLSGPSTISLGSYAGNAGLLLIDLSVAANAPQGNYPLTFTVSDIGTYMTNAAINPYTLSFPTSYSIQVVPEPASIGLAATASIALLGYALRRWRRRGVEIGVN